MEDKYLFFFVFYKPKFSPLASCEMALAFLPPFSRWFIFGSSLNDLKNTYKKPTQRVVPTKFGIHNYQGYLHIDTNHVEVLCDVVDGGESRFVGFDFPSLYVFLLNYVAFLCSSFHKKNTKDATVCGRHR